MKLFKEVKRGAKKLRENSYFDGKKRIYYEYVIVDEDKAESHFKKGFHLGLPDGEAKKEQVTSDAQRTDSATAANIPVSEGSDTEPSA